MLFGGFIDWVILILLIYIITKLSSFGSRLNALEKTPKTHEAAQSTTPSIIDMPTQKVAEQKAALFPNPKIEPRTPSSVDTFFSWYAHEWMLKTGAIFILLGFIWFATYAFLHNWIGPTGRITVGLVAGAVILYFGQARLAKIRTQGITLVWLGAAVMTITMYAGQYKYHLFPSFVALLFLAFVSVITALISWKHNSLSLAVASLVIGGFTPIIINSPEKSIFGLYSYLIVVVVGTIWIARHRRWEILTFLALVLTTLYSVTYFFYGTEYLSSSLVPMDLLQLRFFAALLISIFFSSNLITIITNKEVNSVDLLTAGAIGLYTYA